MMSVCYLGSYPNSKMKINTEIYKELYIYMKINVKMEKINMKINAEKIWKKNEDKY